MESGSKEGGWGCQSGGHSCCQLGARNLLKSPAWSDIWFPKPHIPINPCTCNASLMLGLENGSWRSFLTSAITPPNRSNIRYCNRNVVRRRKWAKLASRTNGDATLFSLLLLAVLNQVLTRKDPGEILLR